MGKRHPSEPEPPTWLVLFQGGGPLDGDSRTYKHALDTHVTQVLDGAFEGTQTYRRVSINERAHLVILQYEGEHWGPRLAEEGTAEGA